MTNLLDLALLYLAPSRLLDRSVNDGSNRKPEKKADARTKHKERIETIRKVHAGAFILVVFVSTVGFSVAQWVNETTPIALFHIRVFRLFSIIVIASAVLGRLGREIETIGGTSRPERVNLFAFKFFYTVGLFLAVVALFLEPSPHG